MCFAKREGEPWHRVCGSSAHGCTWARAGGPSGRRPSLCWDALIVPLVAQSSRNRFELFPTKFRVPGAVLASVSSATYIPLRAQFLSPLIIPGGLVLCSWIKLGQLSLTGAKLHTWPQGHFWIPSEGKLDLFQVCSTPSVHRAACGKCEDKGIIAYKEARQPCGFALDCMSMFGKSKGSLLELLMSCFCGTFL